MYIFKLVAIIETVIVQVIAITQNSPVMFYIAGLALGLVTGASVMEAIIKVERKA